MKNARKHKYFIFLTLYGGIFYLAISISDRNTLTLLSNGGKLTSHEQYTDKS